jgi:hypothetical protein
MAQSDKSNDKNHSESRNSPAARSANDPRRETQGDGPGKIGLTSDAQPDLVSPSGVNERDHGAADDKPMGGGSLNFDDGGDMVHPRGKVTANGGTWQAQGGDSGNLDKPAEIQSDRIGPSDPDNKRSGS